MRTIEFVVSPINLGIHRRAGIKLYDDSKFAGSVVVANVYDQVTDFHLAPPTPLDGNDRFCRRIVIQNSW